MLFIQSFWIRNIGSMMQSIVLFALALIAVASAGELRRDDKVRAGASIALA